MCEMNRIRFLHWTPWAIWTLQIITGLIWRTIQIYKLKTDLKFLTITFFLTHHFTHISHLSLCWRLLITATEKNLNFKQERKIQSRKVWKKWRYNKYKLKPKTYTHEIWSRNQNSFIIFKKWLMWMFFN